MKNYKMILVCVMMLGLCGCSRDKKDDMVLVSLDDYTISKEETISEQTSELVFSMEYSRSLDMDKIMNALLTSELEKEIYENISLVESTSKYTDLKIYEGSMKVEKVNFRWTECNGGFSYYASYPIQDTDVAMASIIMEEFLKQMEWDYSDDFTIKKLEDGSIDISCSLFCDGIKLMGDNSLFLEKDNENEFPIMGFYVKLLVSGDRIYSATIEGIPNVKNKLQSYDVNKDLLQIMDVEKIVQQYLAGDKNLQHLINADVKNIVMDIELIYMPYRDLSSNKNILIPVYEVCIKNRDESVNEEILLYIDAITGFMYDIHFRFS